VLRCEMDDMPEKRDIIKDIRKKSLERLKDALEKGDFKKAMVLYEEIALLCLELNDVDMSVEFSDQARILRERLDLPDGVEDKQLSRKLKETTHEFQERMAVRKYLIDFQNKASRAFVDRNYKQAKRYIREMLAIVKKTGDKRLIKNYRENLKKVELAEARHDA